ncbi:MAG: tRNA (guanosine(37)-N1)-methyltransferase TrmD [Myxococcales bacterium]|nr:tRNA (guanosine(37)-N1)-methyltransferase TrmD [Myxococcales bacterium]
MTRFTVVSILPEIVDAALAAGVVGRARTAGSLTLAFQNPRDFTHDRHRSVDDTPYGGGPGMVMRCEPLAAAIDAAGPGHRVFLGPSGAPLTQATVRRLAALEHVVLVCGRYEGVDQRLLDTAIDEEISLGDFVLTGGELGAACVIDAVARFLPGVLGDAASAEDESFAAGLLEYPQFTRPAVFRDRPIPEVLAGGNHEAIRRWRRTEALRRTARRRPELYARHRLDKADRKLADAAGLDLAARTAVALVHHPVFDRTGAVVTSAVTNLDVHDLARTARTFGLTRYFVVTPVESQRAKAEHIAAAWQELAADTGPRGPGGGHDGRASALRIISAVESVAAAVADLTAEFGQAPWVVATSADPVRFPAAARVTADRLLSELIDAPGQPVLILFGTGWGLADSALPSVTHLLPPVESRTGWNHLSVRSAAAIVIAELFAVRSPAPIA